MTTIKRILAATDLSDTSAAALLFADVIARKFGAEVTALHSPAARLAATSLLALVGAADSVDQLENVANETLRGYVGLNVKQMRPGGGQILLSEAVDAIAATAYDINADLIALGTDVESGRGPFELPFVEQVIEQSGRPVLAVRGRSAGRTSHIEKILCPVNYSALSKRAFDYALLLASAFNASLVVAHTIEEDASEERQEAEADRLRAWVGEFPRSVRLTLLVDQGDAARDIIRYVQSHDVDLLVIGAKSDPFLNRTLLGRTAGILTRHAPCAVLTVPGTSSR